MKKDSTKQTEQGGFLPPDPRADDYFVRYGGESPKWKTEPDMTYAQAVKFYDKLKLDEGTTWKELIYRPVSEKEPQLLLRSDAVRVVDLGIAKMVVPDGHFDGMEELL